MCNPSLLERSLRNAADARYTGSKVRYSVRMVPMGTYSDFAFSTCFAGYCDTDSWMMGEDVVSDGL